MHERSFSSYEFSYEKCSEIFPEIFEPLFFGSEKNPGKFPTNFPLNFPNVPAKNPEKFTDELLQERRKNDLVAFIFLLLQCPKCGRRSHQNLTLSRRQHAGGIKPDKLQGTNEAKLAFFLFRKILADVCYF